MTALYILLGIFGFFAILFSIPVHVVAKVGSELGVWIRFLFIRIPIFPAKKKKKKAGKKKPKKKKEKSKKKAPAEGAEVKKKKPKRDIVGLVKLLLKIVAAVLRKFPRHFGVKIHAYEIIVATGDAAKTAITYGAVTGLSANLFRALRKATRFRIARKAPVNVYADFVGTKTRANVCIDINLTITDVLCMALAAGFAFAKAKLFGPKKPQAEQDDGKKAGDASANKPNNGESTERCSEKDTPNQENSANIPESAPTDVKKSKKTKKKIPDKGQKG